MRYLNTNLTPFLIFVFPFKIQIFKVSAYIPPYIMYLVYDEVLIFTDLLCGTPNNVAVRLMMDEEDITVLTGYNLAILVELVNRRNTTAMKVCELIEDSKEIFPTHGRGQRLGNGFYRYRRIGFHLDGTVDIHVNIGVTLR